MARVLACSLLLLACVAAAAQDKSDKKEAELKWAKGVVNDFMTAGIRGEYEQAAILLADELKKTLAPTSQPDTTFITNRFARTLNGTKSWSIAAEEMSPDQDEACFRGTCTGERGEVEFSARVVKEKESGKWRVLQFTVGEWKKKVEEPKK